MRFFLGAMLSLFVVGCSSLATKTNTKESPPREAPTALLVVTPNQSLVAQTQSNAVYGVQPEHAELLNSSARELKPSEYVAQKNVDTETALKWLQHGNNRYVTGNFRTDGQSIEDRQRTQNEQRPHSIVLSCSDSRVPVEILFDQKIGEIYVVRTTAEQLDEVTIASIEYAVRRFDTNLIYVLGHNHCDAIDDALHANEEYTTTSDTLDSLLLGLKKQLAKEATTLSISLDLSLEAKQHALAIAHLLSLRSSLLAKKMDSGALQIRAGLYRSETGVIETF